MTSSSPVVETYTLKERIGQRIKAARRRRGWSLRALPEQSVGTLGRARLGNDEDGRSRPSVAVALALAEVFGDVSPAWLLCLDDCRPLSATERRLIAC